MTNDERPTPRDGDQLPPEGNLLRDVLMRIHPVSIWRSYFFWAGFFWGLPIPIGFLWFHAYLTAKPATVLYVNYPIHWVFTAHPILFGLVFRVIGSLYTGHTEQLKNQAIRDDLTELYNHRYFRDMLRKRISEARRYGRDLSLIMLDIDHFKQINDRYGHLHGDRILQDLANLLVETTRQSDLVCRYGGEEFTVILPETDVPQAREMAQRLRRKVEDHNFDLEGTMTVSVGVGTLAPDDDDTAEGFINLVDQRLYQAKESGRNRVCGGTDPEGDSLYQQETSQPGENR